MQERRCFQDVGEMSSLKVMPFVGFFYGSFDKSQGWACFFQSNSCFALLFLAFPFNQVWKWGRERSRGRKSMRHSFTKQYKAWGVCCFGEFLFVFLSPLRLLHYWQKPGILVEVTRHCKYLWIPQVILALCMEVMQESRFWTGLLACQDGAEGN